MNVTLRINNNGSERKSHHRQMSKADADALYLLALKQPETNGVPVRKTSDGENNWHWEVPIRLGAYAQKQKTLRTGTQLAVLFQSQPNFEVPIYC